MPPKGWRKNGESSQALKDSELVSIDDILFPRATIQKLAKNVLASDAGDNMSLTKDSLIAVQRAATVFVSHLAFHARQVAREAERKNLNSQDMLVALERANLTGFSAEVKRSLSAYEATVEAKKKSKAKTDEPAAKKLKGSETAVDVVQEQDEAEDEIPDADEDHDSDMDADVVEDDNEAKPSNPIALLKEEEEELEGPAPQARDAVSEEEEVEVRQLAE